MPNGGTPIHMMLRPKRGNVVISCDAGVMSVFTRDAWERDRSRAEPIFMLSEEEGAVLVRHLEHWIEASAARVSRGTVDVQYDL